MTSSIEISVRLCAPAAELANGVTIVGRPVVLAATANHFRIAARVVAATNARPAMKCTRRTVHARPCAGASAVFFRVHKDFLKHRQVRNANNVMTEKKFKCFTPSLITDQNASFRFSNMFKQMKEMAPRRFNAWSERSKYKKFLIE